MVLGVEAQRMGGDPGVKSPLAGQVKQLAALSGVGGKTKGRLRAGVEPSPKLQGTSPHCFPARCRACSLLPAAMDGIIRKSTACVDQQSDSGSC